MLGIKNKLTVAAVIAAIVLVGIIGRLLQVNSDLRADNERQTSNMEQITAENQRQLTLKTDEYEALNAYWKDKVDSIRNEYDIKLSHIEKATVTKISYSDTSKLEAMHGDPVIVNMDPVIIPIDTATDNSCVEQIYNIPVSIDDGCLGFKGTIQSMDKTSKLTISERHFENSIQLIDYWDRRWFLGKKRHKFVAASDCGELDITQINFIKK